MAACTPCLRRAWLLGRLSGHLDLVRAERQYVREVLALSDDDLLAALGGARQGEIAGQYEAFDPGPLHGTVRAAGQHAVCRHDDAYPPSLLELPDPPAVLFVTGGTDVERRWRNVTGDPDGHPAVALVGARRASADAQQMAQTLARDLAFAGVPVISGMALGVDAAAHRGALDGGGATVAVLGCGADVIYPRSERRLYERLLDDGMVLSELPPGSPARKWTFPARNRIIAGLATLTVVVEAAERSGSLITATLAEDLGREVGAVPGRPTVTGTRGSNTLLRQGCAVIRDAQDVLDQLFGAGARVVGRPTGDLAALAPGLRQILHEVRAGRDTVGELCQRPQDVPAVTERLGELEYLGYLRRTLHGRYVVVA